MKFTKTKNIELGRISTEGFKEMPKLPYILVLEDIRSLLNVGSIFRTADAFLAEKLILTGITGKPPHKEIQKTALGATNSVSWLYEESIEKAIVTLKNEGYLIFAVEQTQNSIYLSNFNINREKIALILGNEVEGVSLEALALCDGVIEIPQGGTKHSINVSVAAGLVSWEVFKQLTNE